MMSTRSLNRVMLIGNLTRNVELRQSNSGVPIATFNIATNRSYTESNGKQVSVAEFTHVVAWAKLAEICSGILKKGMKVYVEGRLHTNSWEDEESGKMMYRTEVVATEMFVLAYPKGMETDNSSDTPQKKDSNDSDNYSYDMSTEEE